MKEPKVLISGLQDALNPFNEEEMGFVFGGCKCKNHVCCSKGYTAKDCACGYVGPSQKEKDKKDK